MARFPKSVLLACAVGLIPLGSGCDAPRNNPFDPHSPVYVAPAAPPSIGDLVAVDITPTTARLEWSAPAGAVEYLLYHGDAGWDGVTTLSAIPYSGIIPGVKPAGALQSAIIDLPGAATRVWSLFSRSHNGLISRGSNPVSISPPPRDRPGSISVKTYSIFQSSWIPPDLVELAIDAVIADSDGIDSVWAISAVGDLGQLLLTRDGVTWSAQIVERQVPTGVLERLVGHPIQIFYRDRLGFTTGSAPTFLSRVIYTPPLIESPSGDSVEAHPRLLWYPYNAEYIFTYGVDIVFVSTPSYVQTPIYRRRGIDSDSTSHTVEDSLIARQGFYFWTLSVEDEFGNQAYSTELTFTVADGE